MDKNITINTKLEVALEILAAKIADTSKKGLSVEDKEMQQLIKERQQLYSGDEKILDKIIEEYGPEMKRKYEEAGK